MNAGERNEILIKLHLISMRDRGDFLDGLLVESVGFAGKEYLSIPSNVSQDLCLLNDEELCHLASTVGISKSGSFNKSDVYINDFGFSLKCFSAASPAIVNHTARPGFETACKFVGVDIRELDKLIDSYWDLRFREIITEDVKNSDMYSPFKESKNILKPVLEYFMFVGSGRGPSKHRADYILHYTNPYDSTTWHILTPNDAVDFIWDRLIFSLRSKKGMPSNYYKETYDGPNSESIARWTQYYGGAYKGALHIRIHR